MRTYEREAFVKTFGIFFISLTLLTSLATYGYYKEQKHAMDEQIFAQMKAFTYDFKSKVFEVDVVAYSPEVDEVNIHECDEGVCGYFRIESAPNSMFKVIMPQLLYEETSRTLVLKVFLLYALMLCAIFGFALFYSLYALYPLKKALHMMEDFLKDVIHDLNTPVTSILLNTKMLRKQNSLESLERIELGAKTIASLYQNLEVLQKGFVPHPERVELEALLRLRAKTFQKLYPSLEFVFETEPCTVHSDINALHRIIDNILSNACKYSRKKGKIVISNRNHVIIIRDGGIGMKYPSLAFERYYKEGNRGLGLGLHIVKRLCDALNIAIVLQSTVGVGTSVSLTFCVGEKQ